MIRPYRWRGFFGKRLSMPKNIKNREFKDLESDKKTLYAVIRYSEILGEVVKKIPKNVKEKYPENY